MDNQISVKNSHVGNVAMASTLAWSKLRSLKQKKKLISFVSMPPAAIVIRFPEIPAEDADATLNHTMYSADNVQQIQF